MARTFVAKCLEVEARFLLAGETFERKSVDYRAFAPATTEGDTALIAVLAEHPDGGGGMQTLRLPARLAVWVTGRYV